MTTKLPDDIELARMQAAADWLIRLHDAPGDEALMAEWLKWCDSHPDNLAAFQRAQSTWIGALPEAKRRPAEKRKRLLPLAWAASLVLALGAALWLGNQRADHGGLQSYATPVGGSGSSVLPDGSSVELGANSRITTRYSPTQRAITVDAGEAYFAVAKDPSRPFVVTAGDVQVIAVGTAFNVRRASDRVVVGVEEGVVRIADSESRDEPVALEAGKQATYVAESRRVAVAPIEPEDAAPWRQGVLKYMHEPLSTVAADLSRYSDRQIVVTDPQLANMPFTGTVFTSRILDAVHALEDVFPLQVVERESAIELVSSSGSRL